MPTYLYIYAIVLLIVLQVLDLVTTVIALRNPNNYEANGILAPLMKQFGTLPVLVVVKISYIGILYFSKDNISDPTILFILAAVYADVVYKNYKLMNQA